MSRAEDLGPTYHQAFDDLSDSVQKLQRTIMASVMTMYPNRDELSVAADFLRDEINADAIQVNVILSGKQLTIVSAPDGTTSVTEIPIDNSLCVLTVGANTPLHIDNLKENKFLTGQAQSTGDWGSWASAPIRLNNQPVGAVCALGDEPREWSKEDEMLIQATCTIIEKQVTDWLKSRKESKNGRPKDTA